MEKFGRKKCRSFPFINSTFGYIIIFQFLQTFYQKQYIRQIGKEKIKKIKNLYINDFLNYFVSLARENNQVHIESFFSNVLLRSVMRIFPSSKSTSKSTFLFR
jgi:hypothetical protein